MAEAAAAPDPAGVAAAVLSPEELATDAGAEWPLAKMLARHQALQQAGESRKPAVLVTTGAMNPVHLGHVDMFARARRCLEQDHDYCVLAGYISPSHEGYVRPKCESFKQRYLEAELRLECVRRVVQDSDWLACGAWEAAPARGSWPDYPVVVQALQSHLSEHNVRLGGHKCTVFYVCGLDHFKKCHLSAGLRAHRSLSEAASSHVQPAAGVVAIPREDAPPARTDLKRLVVGVTELNPQLSHLSSTKVRKLLKASGGGGGGSAAGMSVEERRAAVAQVVGGAVTDLLLPLAEPAAIGGGAAAEPEPEPFA